MEKIVSRYGNLEYVSIYHPDRKAVVSAALRIDGMYYTKEYRNETGGVTTEYSLRPFDDGKSGQLQDSPAMGESPA